MTDYFVSQSQLKGEVRLPASKSHSIRAILFAAMAKGRSVVRGALDSPDIASTIRACRQLGATIDEQPDYLVIEGVVGRPRVPDDVIDAGNSGQVLRFIGALSGLCDGYTIITGDHSIRHQRPIQPLLDGLKGLGVFAESTRQNGYAPIVVKGPLKAGRTHLRGEDSQPVSGLLIASSFVPGITEIDVSHPGECPWVDMTLWWLHSLGIRYENHDHHYYKVYGQATPYPGFDFTVPGDFSSAAYPIVAALLTDSEVIVSNVDMDDIQGDKKLISVLQQMGGIIDYDGSGRRLLVRRGDRLKGMTIDVNEFIDAITILAVVGCFSEGETRIVNGANARNKESDRISSITRELRRMGAKISETSDGLVIKTSKLTSAELDTYQDHRMVMSLSVAAMTCSGTSKIKNVDCVSKSYPLFADHMRQMGACITS